MGRGERDAVTDGGNPSGQNKATEIFHDVTSGFTGLFHRTKKKVEEQINNIDTDQLKDQVKDQAGRIGDGIKDRAQQEVNGVRSDIDQAKKGNYQPLINRGIETGISAGTFGVGGIAGDVAKRFGLGGKIGGFVEKKVEEATRVDTAGFVRNLNDMFDTVDKNHDGYMDKDEIAAAKQDKVFWAQHAFSLKYLSAKYDDLRQLSNDEWFSESSGVSRGDVKALANAVEKGTGFGASLGAAFDKTWENTWHAAALGGAAGAGTAYLKNPNALKIGLIVGGVALAGGLVLDTADYLMSRRGRLATTIKDLG